MSVNWRRQYDEASDARARNKTRVRFDDSPSLTQQSFTTDCDLNVLVKRFGIDKGPLPVVPVDASYYGDFSNVPDLKTALDRVRDAQMHFDALPSALRKRFDNSPGKLWDFVTDLSNLDEAIKLGLLAREADPASSPSPGQPAVASGAPAAS